MLIADGRGLNLPYDVPANEYLNIEDKKISTSRRWTIDLPDFLSRYDPDPLRYALTINAPETRDVNFTWEEFLRRNNDELVATWGNLVNRVLGFAYKRFDGRVPEPGEFDEMDRALAGRIGGCLRARRRRTRCRAPEDRPVQSDGTGPQRQPLSQRKSAVDAIQDRSCKRPPPRFTSPCK